jgi:hypothetical protein
LNVGKHEAAHPDVIGKYASNGHFLYALDQPLARPRRASGEEAFRQTAAQTLGPGHLA